MLLFLLNFLQTHFGITTPAAFRYSSTRMLLAAITGLVCTLLLGPVTIRVLQRLRVSGSIRVDEHIAKYPALAELAAKHEDKRATPTMGGILILASMLLSLMLWMDLTSSFTLLLFVATVGLGLLGGIDDFLKLKYKNSKGVRGRTKLFLQIALAALIGTYTLSPAVAEMVHQGDTFQPPVAKEWVGKAYEGVPPKVMNSDNYFARYYVPFFKKPIATAVGWGLVIAFFITLFVIVGTSNAVNLTDGLDGLASGCLVMCSMVLAIFAFMSNNADLARYLGILYVEGSGEIAIYLSALIGACLGFLWYNGHPAQIFMGDTGSLALGGVVGLSAVLLRREGVLAIAGGIFVAEALSVMMQVGYFKWTGGKRILRCAPLHHHFEYQGWTETKVVMRFWIVNILLAILAIMSLKLQ